MMHERGTHFVTGSVYVVYTILTAIVCTLQACSSQV